MKQIATLLHEVRVADDGAIMVRRKDRKPLTESDHQQARRLADSMPGVTVADVLRVFPGAKVVSQ